MDLHKSIEDFLLTEICPELGIEITEIPADHPLIDSGILDSLGILKLLSHLDEELNLDISGSDIKQDYFVTISSICGWIDKQAKHA